MTQPKIEGVGADAPTETNAHGGNQSSLPYRCDLLQTHALLHLAKIMEYGARKYGENNWHKITCNEHLNHALVHLFAHLAGDTQDDHLGHAAWRVMSALDQVLSGREAKLKEPNPESVAGSATITKQQYKFTNLDGSTFTVEAKVEASKKSPLSVPTESNPHCFQSKFKVGDVVLRGIPFFWGTHRGVVRELGMDYPLVGNPDDLNQNAYCLEDHLVLEEVASK